MIEFIMEYSFECKRDHLGYLRVVLPAELEYFSDFIEDIVSVDEADEYLKMIQDVLDGSSEEYEIQLNTTIAYIKEDQTVIEHLYTENENDRSSMETEKFKKLILDWRDKIPKGIRVMIKTLGPLKFKGPFYYLNPASSFTLFSIHSYYLENS